MQWQTGFTWVHICEFGALWLQPCKTQPLEQYVLSCIFHIWNGKIVVLMGLFHLWSPDLSHSWEFKTVIWSHRQWWEKNGQCRYCCFEFMVAPILLHFLTQSCRASWKNSMYISATQSLLQKCSPGEVNAGWAQCRNLSTQVQAKK